MQSVVVGKNSKQARQVQLGVRVIYANQGNNCQANYSIVAIVSDGVFGVTITWVVN